MLRPKEKVEENDVELVRINIHSIHLTVVVVEPSLHSILQHVPFKTQSQIHKKKHFSGRKTKIFLHSTGIEPVGSTADQPRSNL